MVGTGQCLLSEKGHAKGKKRLPELAATRVLKRDDFYKKVKK